MTRMLVFCADGMDYKTLRSGEVETPFIKELMSKGAHGEMRIIYEEERVKEGAEVPANYSSRVTMPTTDGGGALLYYSLTPVSFTCLCTGMYPWKNLVEFESDGKVYSSSYIKYDRVWKILERQGISTLVLDVPFSKRVEGLKTLIYPCRWSEGNTMGHFLDGRSFTIPEMYKDWVEASKWNFNKLKNMMRESPSDVVMIYFREIDCSNHIFFDISNPERKAKWRGDEELTSLIVHDFYRRLDDYLKELSTGFDYVMVISDHGTERSHHTERATFILVGPTIPPGEVYGVRSIDVTPTILHLMEADGDYKFDGVNLFLSQSEQEEELRKLRALGYIE